MKTASEFKAFFGAIPEEQWTTGTVFNRRTGQCCAIGHLTDANQDWHAMRHLADRAVGEDGLILVNDGFHPEYPQPTPKARVLALCEDLIKAGK